MSFLFTNSAFGCAEAAHLEKKTKKNKNQATEECSVMMYLKHSMVCNPSRQLRFYHSRLCCSLNSLCLLGRHIVNGKDAELILIFKAAIVFFFLDLLS